MSVEAEIETFRDEVEAFLTLTGMSPSRFGREVVSNPSFVFGLRKAAGSPRPKTVDKVREWMKLNAVSRDPARPPARHSKSKPRA